MQENQLPAVEDRHLHGKILYGDDFDEAEIRAWFDYERSGYFELYKEHVQHTDSDYAYASVNTYHAFSRLKDKRFKTCLALGCAEGDDVKPLAAQVDKFIAIEPAKEWWRDSIGGKPATYMMPEPAGKILLEDESVDIVVGLGVLHHIPNVSYLLDEIHRTLSAGGYFIAREPISSMGDFREPRVGCTKYERGIPIDYFKQKLGDLGFAEVSFSPALFPPLIRVLEKLSASPMPRSPLMTRVDALLSRAFAFNDVYFRDTLWKKFAPGSSFIIARK